MPNLRAYRGKTLTVADRKAACTYAGAYSMAS